MKRLFDFILSLSLLFLISPILLLIVICVLCIDGSPLMFYQERVGKDMRPFRIVKFRTMKNNNKNVGEVFKGNVYVTKTGAILRRTKLDEVPQLFNVLCGHMSFIGPRPVTWDVAQNHITSSRFAIKPGLTGLAQVSGNIHLSREARFQLDEYYVAKKSLYMDIKIVVRTVGVVFLGEKIFLK